MGGQNDGLRGPYSAWNWSTPATRIPAKSDSPKHIVAEDDGPDGMLAYQLAIAKPDRNDPNWPLPSFDARDWAKSFVEIATKNGHGSLDEGWMISWFANALMRGYDEHAMRVGKESPSPAAIAAFMDTVRRLNNSVDFGEVEPAAGVWRWLEELAGGTLSVKAEVSEFDRGMMLVRHAVERLIDTDHAIGVDDRGIIDNILAMLAVGPTR